MSSQAVRSHLASDGSAESGRRCHHGLLVAVGVLVGGVASAQTAPPTPAVADAVMVTILSSNLADGVLCRRQQYSTQHSASV
jgi:hypothetical protein